MALIPVLKECTREYLMEKWGVEFSISDWVSIEFPFQDVKHLDKDIDENMFEIGENVEYETNRYDMQYHDSLLQRTISVYLYMDEGSSKIIAIDGVVQDCENEDTAYPMEETPFADMLKDIRGQ